MASHPTRSHTTHAPITTEQLWALLGLFLGILVVRLLLELLLAHSPLPALAAISLESALCTVIAGVTLVRPTHRWLEQERRRVRSREVSLRRAAERQEFTAELAAALGHSVDEGEARWVIQRALDQASPDAPVELLLTEPGSSRLSRAVDAGLAVEGFGCPVQRSGDCPAIRSGQARGGSSADLDACRLLAERPGGVCHGLCLPVTINGQALGVLHTARPAPPEEEARVRLRAIAEQAGVRLGLFRAMAATRKAAATDELTGLLNRRALSERVEQLDAAGRRYAVVIADIDHFKRLNDTYGHQVGDRALQAFAYALHSAARPEDIVARLGGEEFVLLFPGASAEGALSAVDRIQKALPQITDSSSLPHFTASFGIADPRHGKTLDDLLQAADEALYAAKDAGRDQAMVAALGKSPLRQVV